MALYPLATDLVQPIGVVPAHDGSGRLFILEKKGAIRILEGDTLRERPFLNIRRRLSTRWEGGLLGLAFEPGHPERFYLNYTNLDGDSTLARYRVREDDPNLADRRSEEILLTVEQPEDNHNGGHLLFGPDGYLWMGLGDGGGQGDHYRSGQNTHALLSSLLRLDVSPERGYRVPPDNPFYGDEEAGAAIIWAIGLRNPWHFSFDRRTGELWIADVGHRQWEEINHVASDAAALNYGWPITEGRHCYRTETCETEGLVTPVAEYSHTRGCAVVGGHVYRGEAIPALQGQYLFGDFCTGRIWSVAADGKAPMTPELLLDTDLAITAFGEDEAGELYITHYEGALYRLVAAP